MPPDPSPFLPDDADQARAESEPAGRSCSVLDARPGWAVHAHDVLGSTSDEARRLAREGAPHGTTVWARTQTAGRGRRGRTWASPEGNLHMSVVLRCTAPLAPQLGFVSALAVADAVDAVCGSAVARLKWPNDILISGAKLAGLLLEVEHAAVVVGIGVNLRHVPPELHRSATSLHSCGVEVVAEAMLERVQHSLRVRLQLWQDAGFVAILAAWLERGHQRGDAMRISTDDGQVDGVFVGLDGDGSLLAEVDGAVRRFVSGEVLTA